MKKEKIVGLVAFLGTLGMLLSAYLIYLHYKPSGSSFCSVNDYLNCDVVNKSPYAELGGIPVAVLGFLAYGALLTGSLLLRRSMRQILITTMTLFAAASFFFSLYLTYIEFFVLSTLCLLCLTSQLIIFIILIALLYLFYIWHHLKKSSPEVH